MLRSIPFFSLERQWSQLRTTLLQALAEVGDSQQFIGGSFVQRFEEDLARYLPIKQVISCNSGTDALWLALKALELPAGALVLTTPFSFIASASEIVAHEAHPVFIDVDQNTYNIAPHALQAWLEAHAVKTPRGTRHIATQAPIAGMIVVNIFGQCAEWDALQAIAQEWGLWIVEDAAQSIGSAIGAQKAGTLGDIACFSFYPTKNLGACGDAGAVVTNNEKLAAKILQLRNHGRFSAYDYQIYGVNSRLDGMQAAILSQKLPLLDSWNARRRAIAALYEEQLGDLPGIQLPTQQTGVHTFHQYTMVVTSEHDAGLRDKLRAHLTTQGVGTNIFYPRSLSSFGFLTNHEYTTTCPVADALTHTVLALPIWPELADEEVLSVCRQVQEFIHQQQLPHNAGTRARHLNA